MFSLPQLKLTFFSFLVFFAQLSFSAEPQNPPVRMDADFSTFLYALGLSENGSTPAPETGSGWSLQYAARREVLATGQTPQQLYVKFQSYLSRVHPALQKLLLIHQRIQRREFNESVKCVEFGVCLGLFAGFSLRFSLGVKRSPLFSWPVLGIKTHFHPVTGNADVLRTFIFGAGLQLGTSDLVNNPNESSSLRRTDFSDQDEAETGGALVGGYYKSTTPQQKNSGAFLGLLVQSTKARIATLQIPIPIPAYRMSFEEPVSKHVLRIILALYNFDFELADARIAALNNLAIRLEKKFAQRGLSLTQDEALPVLAESNPLYKPGALFNPPTILRYAPALLPEAMRSEGCEMALGAGKKKRQLSLTLFRNE